MFSKIFSYVAKFPRKLVPKCRKRQKIDKSPRLRFKKVEYIFHTVPDNSSYPSIQHTKISQLYLDSHDVKIDRDVDFSGLFILEGSSFECFSTLVTLYGCVLHVLAVLGALRAPVTPSRGLRPLDPRSLAARVTFGSPRAPILQQLQIFYHYILKISQKTL